MPSRRKLLAAAGVTMVALPWSVGRAQTPSFPSKPVQIIVPFSAGGGVDLIGRTLAEELRHDLGSVIVENRDGAGSNIGIEFVSRAEPTGHVILLASIGFAINRFLFENLTYNPDKDFTPVSLLCRAPNVMVVPPNSPAKNLREFIALAKASPGKMTFASSGQGSSLFLAAQLFQREAGVELTHVPYRGSAPALVDVRAGRVDAIFDVVSSVASHITSGGVRALGVTSADRVPAFPNLETMAENGLPGFDFSSWFGFFVPSGTPAAVVERIHRATVKALAVPAVRTKLEQTGALIVGSTPNELRKHVENEVQRWRPVLQKK